MRLSAKAIQEFKEIWKDEFNEELSDAAAEEEALRLLSLFSILTRSLPASSQNSPDVNNNVFDKSFKTRTIEE